MLRIVLVLFFLTTLLLSVNGQQPQPSPSPAELDNEVLKISTALVQLDVIVTDKNGNQVTELNPKDFNIFVNGKKQEITNFSYIFSKSDKESDKENETRTAPKEDRIKVPPPPSKVTLESVRRTYAIVIDDLGLSFESIPAVRQSIRKFISDQMLDGDLVAIVRTGSGVGALQSFTSDKTQLLAAVDKIKWNSQGRGGLSVFSTIAKDIKEEINATSKGGRTVEGADADKEFEKQLDEFRNENFAVGTLGALNYIIRGMRELPGRKALMVVSEGFVLVSNNAPTRVFDAMRVLADVANRASVVIYTIDPRGLSMPDMFYAQDDVTDIFSGSSGASARDLRVDGFRDSQQSLRYLSYETGGIPFVNQNDLNKGLQRAVDDQTGYYLIGYQPDSDTFDPKKNKFNKVEIKLNRDDLRVRYRSGFFGVTDKKLEAVKKTPGQQVYGALLSPFGSNDISLGLNTLFAQDDKGNTFLRSLVAISAKDLEFSKDANGMYKANFDIIAMTFGDNGVPVDEASKNYTISFGEKTFENVLKNGFIYDLTVPVKKPGAYQFRVAIRDSKTERVGSASQFIEVPDLRKKRLGLSSIVLENYSIDEWKNVISGNGGTNPNVARFDVDTALRHFQNETVLRFDYIVYNAKLNSAVIEASVRLFRDGRLVKEGEPSKLETGRQTDPTRLEAAGVITLGKDLGPGNYVLQIIVKDILAKEKYNTASRWIDFEIID